MLGQKSLQKCFCNTVSSLLVLLASLNAVSWAHDKARVGYQTGRLESAEQGEHAYQKFIEDVAFTHEGITIRADAVNYYDQKGILEAHGHIKIINEDGSVLLVADRLSYDVNKKLVQLRSRVVYQPGTIVCYTDQLDYEVDTQRAYFSQGGKLVSGDHILHSESGHYDHLDKTATFHQQTELVSPDQTLQCDSLQYNIASQTAQFTGPTKVMTQNGAILTTEEGGTYNTSSRSSTFKHGKVETADYILMSDLLKADQTADRYTTEGQVQLIVKNHKTTITGDSGQYWKAKRKVQVSGNPLMQHVTNKDTLYLAADTFLVQEEQLADGSIDTVVQAYNNVKIYQSGLQGKADSMAYHSLASTMYFYNKPILWSYDSQITAETISIVLHGQELRKMYMDQGAFIATEDALGNFNQLKGSNMVAHFKDQQITCIATENDSESLYFIIDDHSQLVGMNYLKCSHIRLDLDQQKPTKISFFAQPTGVFYPPNKIVADQKKLVGFSWHIAERPTLPEILARGCSKYA